MCKDCIADATNPYCVPSHYEINYEPKDEPKTQMKTQNSNLTFETADTPQTEKADRIPYDPLVEMDIKRAVEERLRQTETSTNSEKLQSGVELKQTDCP